MPKENFFLIIGDINLNNNLIHIRLICHNDLVKSKLYKIMKPCASYSTYFNANIRMHANQFNSIWTYKPEDDIPF